MTVTVNWMEEPDTLVLLHFENKWTWEEFDEAVQKSWDMIRSRDGNSGALMDTTESPSPPSPTGLAHFYRSWTTRPPNLDHLIVVGASAFMRQLSEIFGKAFVQRHEAQAYFVDSVEDAVALHQKYHKAS
jgi:hypothetical protein